MWVRLALSPVVHREAVFVRDREADAVESDVGLRGGTAGQHPEVVLSLQSVERFFGDEHRFVVDVPHRLEGGLLPF